MDTLTHCAAWVAAKFGNRLDEAAQVALASRLMEVYHSDPELYGRIGWWRVYEALPAHDQL